jgi:transposase
MTDAVYPGISHHAFSLQDPEGAASGRVRSYDFVKCPVIVNSLFLKKPELLEALGLILLLALLIWRLMERAMRRHVETTRTPLPGWDKKATTRPTACMRVTQFVGL